MKCSQEPFTCLYPGPDTPNQPHNRHIYKISFNIIFPWTGLINIRYVLYVWLKDKGTDILTEALENTENPSEIFSLFWMENLTAENIVLAY